MFLLRLNNTRSKAFRGGWPGDYVLVLSSLTVSERGRSASRIKDVRGDSFDLRFLQLTRGGWSGVYVLGW